MKKASPITARQRTRKLLKILISVLLVLTIFVSVVWYLFEYDPGFTRDFLLNQARKYESRGRNDIAVWLYELAYRQADQDDSVALELAEYYKSIGNYSKAEYTLSKAIEDGATIELYIALSSIFVEQDKLRDAVLMLDQVSAPEIKAQLAQLRPEAPVASYPSGSYSQYITISLSSNNATVYAATDLDYPSIKTDLFHSSATLSRGDTTFYAVSVAENGLVSTMEEFHYTVDGVIEEVYFADSAFEAAVRSQLGLDEDTPIYSNTLWEITSFQVPSSAASCEDLAWMPNLTELTISSASFSSLQMIEKMTKLHTLTITDSVLASDDLHSISQLPELKKLTLSGCYLSSIQNLADATNLVYLDLSRNSIRDIGVLSHFTQLEHLNLSQNAVISLEAIGDLTGLQTLDVSYNSLVDTAPVGNLTQLTNLNISANNLVNAEVLGIENLTSLTIFSASHNQLYHIAFLANATQLKNLNISNNTIIDISALSNHTQLEYLDFSYNDVTGLPAFSEDCKLTLVNGGYNALTSLDPLSVLQKLEYVYMDYNKPLKNVDALAKCPVLRQVNVYGTSVRSARKLIDKGILVNYKPT